MCRSTAWVSPSATTTTTAGSTCSSPRWAKIGCSATKATASSRDVTDAAGVAGGEQDWSTSCGWFDYDNDGDLDLFVCNYVHWSREYDESQNFQLVGGGRAYGRPQSFEGTFPFLYRNDGDGRFTEVAEQAGLQVRNPATKVPVGKSLGVTFADVDADGWIDIIVANDTVQNFLFHNLGDGTFREVGVLAGVAFDMNGMARGAMGIDVGSLPRRRLAGNRHRQLRQRDDRALRVVSR